MTLQLLPTNVILTSLNLVLNNGTTMEVYPNGELDEADTNKLNAMIEFDNDGDNLEMRTTTAGNEAAAICYSSAVPLLM